MGRIIGTVTSYSGREHAYLRGLPVKIIAVFKGAANPALDPEDGYPVATNDEELAALGGLEADDRVEVVPFLEQAGRYSFVSSDARAVDLDLPGFASPEATR